MAQAVGRWLAEGDAQEKRPLLPSAGLVYTVHSCLRAPQEPLN